MRLFDHSLFIDRPCEDVFDCLTDWSRAPRWRRLVRSVQPLDDRPLGPGSKLRVTFDVAGATRTREIEVLAVDRPRVWRHRSEEDGLIGDFEYRLEPEGAGTRVHLSCDASPSNLYGWLALPVLWLRGSASYREQLPNLKRVLETTSTA